MFQIEKLEKHTYDGFITNQNTLTVATTNEIANSRSRYGGQSENKYLVNNDGYFPVLYSVDELKKSEHAWDGVSKVIVGISKGRAFDSALNYMKNFGMSCQKSEQHERCCSLVSDNFIMLENKIHVVQYLMVKPSDMRNCLTSGLLDMAVCYGDLWYDLDDADYNIKSLGKFVDDLGDSFTTISLIGYETEMKIGPVKIASEYRDAYRLLRKAEKKLPFDLDQVTIVYVGGSVEGYVTSGIVDYAITVVQSGETLEINNLKRIIDLRQIYLNMWIEVDPIKRDKKKYELFTALRQTPYQTIILDGIDGAGKSYALSQLKTDPRIHNVLLYDRHPSVYKKTLQKISEWGWKLELPKNAKVIIIDQDPNLCYTRLTEKGSIEKYEDLDSLNFFRLRYRELASHYGLFMISEDQTPSEVILNIINGDKSNVLPKMNGTGTHIVSGLKIHAEGESKIVYEYNERFDIICYKPSVYSHKRQRGGSIKGTDRERFSTTRNIMYLLAKDRVPHTYWYVGDGYILAERIRGVIKDGREMSNPPPVEVCVKGYHVGTPKHIYHKMDEYLNRFNIPVVDNTMKYQEPIVRFDWRNPNHVRDTEKLIDSKYTSIFSTPLKDAGMSYQQIEVFFEKMFPHGVPLGDYAMCDEMADLFIDTTETKKLVKRAFNVLTYHFAKMNIRFKDVCFMVTIDGKKIFGEISQDCGRYELIDTNGMNSLDKDIWRAGGSSELVLEKWRRLSLIIDNYVSKYLEQFYKDIGLLD